MIGGRNPMSIYKRSKPTRAPSQARPSNGGKQLNSNQRVSSEASESSVTDNRISTRQISKIWTIGRKVLRIPDDDIYLIVFGAVGKDSISGLTKAEGMTVIRRMESMIAKSLRSSNVFQMISDDQKKMITSLCSQINTHRIIADPEAISKRLFKKQLGALSTKQAQSVIEALKSILFRSQNRA
jgi:hypothetical protein